MPHSDLEEIVRLDRIASKKTKLRKDLTTDNIYQTLQMCDGNKAMAAKMLNCSIMTLYSRLANCNN